jgi:transcriptional regulator with XRE-family HTH domain
MRFLTPFVFYRTINTTTLRRLATGYTMCDIEQSERDMAGQPKYLELALNSSALDCADRTRSSERTMRMLQRIADVLGRPVEDFFRANTEETAREIKAGAVEPK